MKLTSFNNLLAAAFVVSAAAGVAVSCQQTPTGPETPDPLDGTTEVIIPVSLERPINPDADSTTPDTRVTVNPTNGVTAWEVGDEVSVYIKPTTSSSGEYVTANVKDNAIHVSIPATKMRAGYAVYPAGKADGNASTVYVTYPSSYDMTGKDLTATNNWAPTPMVALNTEGDDLRFFHIGGLLRLHVTDIPSGTTSLTLTFTITGSNYLAGKFTVVNPGTINATTTYDSGGTNAITFSNLTITNNEVYLNLPIPTTNLSTLSKISISSNSSPAYTAVRDISGWSTIAHAQGKRVTSSFISISFLSGYNGTFKGGLRISPGILKWDDSLNSGAGGYTLTSGENPLELLDYYKQTSSLNVYYHSWDKSTGDDMNKSLKYRIDGNHNNAALQGSIIIDGEAWKLPTQPNLASLTNTSNYTSKINTTGSANARFFKCRIDLSTATNVCGNDYTNKGISVNINTQPGLMLLPEYVSITCPSIGTTTTYFNNGDSNFESITIPWTSMKKLIDAGCVFLPSTGYYNGSAWSDQGNYWSSTTYGTANAYMFYFIYNKMDVARTSERTNYMPVRLVKTD